MICTSIHSHNGLVARIIITFLLLGQAMIHVIFFENISITLMFDPLVSNLAIIYFNFILEFENTLCNYFSRKLL
jgi:hypothetical protein